MIWPKVSLKECARVVGGATPKSRVPEYWDGEVAWVTPKDLASLNAKYIDDTPRKITQSGLKSCSAVMLPAGSVLFSSRAPIGHVAINTISMATNQGFKSMVPGPKLDASFLYWWLREHRARIENLGNGATFKEVSKRVVEQIEILLPPLEEQKRIAAILDKADAIRCKRQRAIQRTEDFLRSVFLDMFGDPVTNPKGWKVLKFGEIGDLDRGISKHRPRNAPELLGGAYPLIQTGDVANSGGYVSQYKSTYSELGLQQSKMWPKGTLCITIAANIAKTGILTFDSCFPDSVVGFTPNERTNTEYVQYWISFLQKILEETAPESAQKNINLRILRELDVPCPSIDEQQTFSKIVKKAKNTKTIFYEQKNLIEDLFNSLTQRAFRGELTNEDAKHSLKQAAVG